MSFVWPRIDEMTSARKVSKNGFVYSVLFYMSVFLCLIYFGYTDPQRFREIFVSEVPSYDGLLLGLAITWLVIIALVIAMLLGELLASVVTLCVSAVFCFVVFDAMVTVGVTFLSIGLGLIYVVTTIGILHGLRANWFLRRTRITDAST